MRWLSTDSRQENWADHFLKHAAQLCTELLEVMVRTAYFILSWRILDTGIISSFVHCNVPLLITLYRQYFLSLQKFGNLQHMEYGKAHFLYQFWKPFLSPRYTLLWLVFLMNQIPPTYLRKYTSLHKVAMTTDHVRCTSITFFFVLSSPLLLATLFITSSFTLVTDGCAQREATWLVLVYLVI